LGASACPCPHVHARSHLQPHTTLPCPRSRLPRPRLSFPTRDFPRFCRHRRRCLPAASTPHLPLSPHHALPSIPPYCATPFDVVARIASAYGSHHPALLLHRFDHLCLLLLPLPPSSRRHRRNSTSLWGGIDRVDLTFVVVKLRAFGRWSLGERPSKYTAC
jgi:hypothetical protein